MQNLFTYKDFHNEAKKEKSAVDFFKEDVKNLLEDMFSKVKKPTYKYDSEGFPTHVEFEIEKSDYEIDYDKLENEFSEGVLAKREFVPVLMFVNKEEKEEGNGYEIEFKIKKEKAEKAKKEEKEEKNKFDKDSDSQLLSKLKSKKTSDVEKEKIMDELKDRGVDYKDPFEDEDEDVDLEKEADKTFGKKSKKNESIEHIKTPMEKQMNQVKKHEIIHDVDERIEMGYDMYGHNSDFSDELDELLMTDASDEEITSFLDDWDVTPEAQTTYSDRIPKGWGSKTPDFGDMTKAEMDSRMRTSESATKDFYHDEIERGMRDDSNRLGDEDAQMQVERDYDYIAQLMKEMGYGEELEYDNVEEFEKSNYFEEDMDDEEYADALNNFLTYGDDEDVEHDTIGFMDFLRKDDDDDDDDDIETYTKRISEEEDDIDFDNKMKEIEDEPKFESVNEGLMGKIAKFLSKAEYEKTLKHVLDCCDEDCTLTDVKSCLKDMVFSKITKQALKDDSKLMTSLAEEILKDIKKEMKTDEKLVSFGSKEWNEKYGVKVEEEQTEVSYNSLVNETLKIKKFDDMENLNDVFNKLYEDNKPARTIDTENK